MLFLETWFWQFAALVIPGYWLVPARFKLAWLLIASLVFHHHFAGPAGMLPIGVLALATWLAGLRIGAGSEAGSAGPILSTRRVFTSVVVLLVATLGFYKYSEFLLADVVAPGLDALGLSAADWAQTWQGPVAPLAISFFTFEFVHYLYEIRRHGLEPVRNPAEFATFAVFFPTLASGPIKRFPDFVPQLRSLSNPGWEKAWRGARRVVLGLFKKICIADLLVEPITVLESPEVVTAPALVLLAVLQGFRIYYDFAGYTDIAIGLSQMLDLEVPENFDRPYFATSLRDFWRRWHMSLSSWIRDYVYIPLGGNRGRRGLHLLLAMGLCGLWHGPSWNFVVWGVYHGAGLGAEAAIRARWPGLSGGGRAGQFARWAACYGFVCYGWLLFFYPIDRVGRMTLEALRWIFA